ncbi:MAG: homoserine dehydrogenase, partial [Actinomycetota bacterium]
HVTSSDVYTEGIERVTAQDIEFARRLGYVVKLLAIAELDGDAIAVRVHPAMVPQAHPLAAVRGSFNAVFVEGDKAGELMFYGPGAGGDPTAMAVVGDLATVARHLHSGGRGPVFSRIVERAVRPIEDNDDQYYLRLEVEDRPGVLAEIAAVLGGNDVSIRSVWQEGAGRDAQLVFITHRAREAKFRTAVRELETLSVVEDVRSILRVEGEE